MGGEGKGGTTQKKSGKAKPLEVELHLSGRFSRGDVIKSSLEGEKEARVDVVEKFNQQEDLETYIQLPAYDDDFRDYGMGIDGVLSKIARNIYANYHKPSWQRLNITYLWQTL